MTAITRQPLTENEVSALDRYWRAANYLAVGQIYLMANPMLTEPLLAEHIKPRLLGHWGTSLGLNFIWAHLNRVITVHDQSMMCVIGPGHGGPAALANTWLEGSYSEVYPGVPQDEAGLARLFRQFSFPGGVPSHVSPETPGSIHEGGELGYSLSHAHGAAFDNPGLIVACVVGDGEAETGSTLCCAVTATSRCTWRAMIPRSCIRRWRPRWTWPSRGSGPSGRRPGPALARPVLAPGRARCGWPMIVMRTPKGWTGPAVVDGLPVEGTWRAHQVPLAEVRTNPGHLRQLEEWMRSYRPEDLFDAAGRPRPELLAFVPADDRRLGASPHANGGVLLRDLVLPDFRDYAVPVRVPGAAMSEPTRVLGGLLRDVMRLNEPQQNFRIFGPDETESNLLGAVLEVTGKDWQERLTDVDEHLARDRARGRDAVRAHLPGLAGRLPADRQAWLRRCSPGSGPIRSRGSSRSPVAPAKTWLSWATGLTTRSRCTTPT